MKGKKEEVDKEVDEFRKTSGMMYFFCFYENEFIEQLLYWMMQVSIIWLQCMYFFQCIFYMYHSMQM